ncbi:MAG: hypothetical protein E7575_04740 [Ruminococcaceae bacterium]|nr:hypothetical protein [Oscillospiraceae bacterium]
MKRENKTFQNAKRLAVASMLCALGFVCLYLGSLSGIFDLCAVVIGSLCCVFAVIELGGPWPYMVAAVTGVLSLLLLPDKFVAFQYVALGGIYPILKSFFERLPVVLSYVAKIVSFNALLSLCLAAAKFIMSISEEWASFNIIVYIVGNGYFIFFDFALTAFITFYMQRIRSKLKLKL